jgi:hypothetical protein
MRRWGLAACGAALVGLTFCGLRLGVGATTGAAHVARVDAFVGLIAIASAVYFVALRIVVRSGPRASGLVLVLGVALLLRVLVLTTPPFLSSDIYRYAWDGRVQAAGVNPYLFVPADPALARLRDGAVYPHINRRDYARTIYPPAAQLVFASAVRIADGVSSVRFAMVAADGVAIACLVGLLGQAGLSRSRVLIYAWNPLVLWSFASDGHVDALAAGFLGLALLLRARRRFAWAGAVLGCAALVKFFPIVVAPALARGGRIWLPALAGLAVIVGLYGFYSDAGTRVLGFLGAYGGEEGLADGSGIWLLAGLGGVVRLPGSAAKVYAVCGALALAALAVWILRRDSREGDVVRLGRDSGMLAASAMVAASPHYSWYFAWLAVPAALAPSGWLVWLATAPSLLLLDPIPHDRFVWPALIYVPALVLLIGRMTRGFQGDTECQVQPR